jgi:flagellar motility protein MotE (MotC chaperone)
VAGVFAVTRPSGTRMIAPLLRAAFATAALGSFSAEAVLAKSAEQDTTNGVAPVHEAPAAPATVPAPGSPAPIGVQAPAAGSTPTGTADTAPSAPAPTPANGNGAQRYCDNIATVATEARFAWQTRKLTELQSQVAQRISELEKKQAELQASLNRRDEAMKLAETTLVGIYAKMQPDAAAAQLALLEDETAAAILAKLNPRQSSAILNEIKPERASQLVATMTNLPKPTDKADGKKS